MIWWLYNMLFGVCYTLMLPYFFLRMKKRGGYRKGFQQRWGSFPKSYVEQWQQGPWYWIHAVSVGEAGVALGFIETWRNAGYPGRFTISVTTSTGYKLVKTRKDKDDLCIYFPIDIPLVMNRVFSKINPVALMLVETELWPNLIRQARHRNIPCFLFNARISDRSFPRYMWVRCFTRRILPLFTHITAQSEKDKKRLVALGADAEAISITTSVKFDVAQPDANLIHELETWLLQRGYDKKGATIVGASTFPGEEKCLVECFLKLKKTYPSLNLILVPRHFERREDILLDLKELDVTIHCRSNEQTAGSTGSNVFLVDTTGELLSIYSFASVVFVGKSLLGVGGQNPIEPASLGLPILFGPHMNNFNKIASEMLDAGAAVLVSDPEQLMLNLNQLLAHPEKGKQMGMHGKSYILRNRGGALNTVKRVAREMQIDVTHTSAN